MSTMPATTAVPTPVVLPLPKAILWLGGTVLFALALYYFIGHVRGEVVTLLRCCRRGVSTGGGLCARAIAGAWR